MHSCDMIYTQVPLLTLNASVATLVGPYHRVRIDCTGKAIWYKLGTSTVVATAGTAGESLLNEGGDHVEFVTGPNQTHVAIIENAASAKASITIFG